MSFKMYAIPNCNTVKKARDWLQENQQDYQFCDLKKGVLTLELLQVWSAQVGWEVLLNRKGMTWRKLDDAARADMNEAKALQLILAKPSIMKRPVIVDGAVIKSVGFDATLFTETYFR
ncbi:MAG: Spx/MgsR family RNA polymerase-binding regulatory protein [Zetaproteobacteria bacterium]|nr:Spx/MgsR family RNA polymerase-binding regulatory protein [Zetaproteobacteria bacterium]